VHAELSWQGRTGSVSVDGAIVATMRRALLRERAEVDLGSAPWVLATGEGFWKHLLGVLYLSQALGSASGNYVRSDFLW
jgi:hypothetical protein